MRSANCKTNQMTVHPLDAIGKTVHFLGAENAVLHPSHNVPPAGRTNVDGKIVFCIKAAPHRHIRLVGGCFL